MSAVDLVPPPAQLDGQRQPDGAGAGHRRARAVAAARIQARIQETKRAEFHAIDLVLDIGVGGSPIVDGDRAGGRLPHAWRGAGHSLYDDLGPGFTLLVLGPHPADDRDLELAAKTCGVPLTTLDLAGRGPRDRYGADLVLVRRDQHVAWAGDAAPADAGGLLDHVRGAG